MGRDILTHIANNINRPHRRGDIHAGERRDTSTSDIEDVVFTTECICPSLESEGEFRKRRNGIAIDSILSIPRFLGTDPSDLNQHISGHKDIKRLTPC